VSKLLFYPRLAWLCFKLTLNLLFLSVELILADVNKKSLQGIVLFALLAASLVSNLYLWRLKNTPIETAAETPSIFSTENNAGPTKKWTLSPEQVGEQMAFYQSLEAKGVQNKAVFLNLSNISLALGESEQSETYLMKALRL